MTRRGEQGRAGANRFEDKYYRIKEVFLSLQGEGVRAGTLAVFVRFSGCNLQCAKEPGPRSPGGFDCDTDFKDGTFSSAEGIVRRIERETPVRGWVVLTGGEPALQLDLPLVATLHDAGFKLAVETNGSLLLPVDCGKEGETHDRSCFPFDWITVSPKVPELELRQKWADEVKYVRAWGQPLPVPRCEAPVKLLSPASEGLEIVPQNVAWCLHLLMQDPTWRVTVQMHKAWRLP